MAELDYDGVPQESFPFDQSQERWSLWALKAYGLPEMYWCVFRLIAIGDSGACRSPVPVHADHRFRRMSITDSGHVDHPAGVFLPAR